MKFFIKENDELQEIEADTLEISKDDIIVIKIAANMSSFDKSNFKLKLRGIFPDNKVVLLPETIEIGVMRK